MAMEASMGRSTLRPERVHALPSFIGTINTSKSPSMVGTTGRTLIWLKFPERSCENIPAREGNEASENVN
jgi:hypothetical protein